MGVQLHLRMGVTSEGGGGTPQRPSLNSGACKVWIRALLLGYVMAQNLVVEAIS